MADVFISYSREDHDAAAMLAAAIEASGWDVWWDREILAGQTFDEVIERELAAANVVVVLWSEHSVTSSWVRSEAGDALERGVLIPALLADVTLPLVFRRAQSANLVAWLGDPRHSGFESLMLSLEARLGPRRPALPPATSTPAAGGGAPAALPGLPATQAPPPREPIANGPERDRTPADTLASTDAAEPTGPGTGVRPPSTAGNGAETPTEAARPADSRAPASAGVGSTGTGGTGSTGAGDGRQRAASGAGGAGTGLAAGSTGAGTTGTAAGTSGTGGGGLVDRLWGSAAAQRRTLVAGALVVTVAIVAILAISLTGGEDTTPLGAVLAADHATLALEAQSGEDASETVLLTNDGDEAIASLRTSVTGSRFEIDSADCAGPLEPGASCELVVRLDASTSAEPETVSERLLIEGGPESLVVALDGTISGTRGFTLAPVSLDLGEVAAGESAEVEVTNDGDVPLAIDVALDGTGFTLTDDCGSALTGGSRCVVTVSVQSRAGISRTAEASAMLVVAVAGLPERRVALSATVVDGGSPVIGPTAIAVAPVADSARITAITLAGGAYAVAFDTTGFTPTLPGQHVHFFFDTVTPAQAGRPGGGPWELYGGPSPFTGYGPAHRPAGANELCILVANADHSVQANTGNCHPLP